MKGNTPPHWLLEFIYWESGSTRLRPATVYNLWYRPSMWNWATSTWYMSCVIDHICYYLWRFYLRIRISLAVGQGTRSAVCCLREAAPWDTPRTGETCASPGHLPGSLGGTPSPWSDGCLASSYGSGNEAKRTKMWCALVRTCMLIQHVAMAMGII